MYTRIMEISPWTLRSAKLEKEYKRLQESLTSWATAIWVCAATLKKPTPPTATWAPTSPVFGSPTKPASVGGKRLS